MTKISNLCPKSENPQNTLENVCVLIKGDVYKDSVRNRILCYSKKVDQECIQNLDESTRRRIYTIRRFDLVEMSKNFFLKEL